MNRYTISTYSIFVFLETPSMDYITPTKVPFLGTISRASNSVGFNMNFKIFKLKIFYFNREK